jgi:hypothetical protein
MSFEVEYVLLSDYASQTADGKWIVAGMYPAEIIFSSEPTQLPTFSITLCLKPLIPQFDFTVEFLSPKGQMVFELQAHHDAENVSPTSRVTMQIPMPPLSFTGAGEYGLIVRSPDSAVRIEKNFSMRVGPLSNQDQIYQAKVEITNMKTGSF